jgi:hypothetical protein
VSSPENPAHVDHCYRVVSPNDLPAVVLPLRAFGVIERAEAPGAWP